MESPGELRRNVKVFGATSFFNDTATEMAYWVLPAFLVSIGAGPATLGIIEGLAESVTAAAKLWSGLLVDRVRQRKPLVVMGYTVANAVKPLLALSTAWWHVLGIRFADRLAKGVRGAPRDVMLSESVPKERVGSAFGLLQTMDSAGAIVGPLLALLLVSHIGLRGVFWAAAVPGLISIIAVVFFAKETGKARAVAHEHRERSKAPLPAAFYYLMTAVGLFSLGNSSDMFLVLRAQDIGIAASYAPLLGLVFNITYTAFSWPAGKLSDRVSRKGLVAAGYLVFTIVYAVFALAPSKSAIWGAFAFYGLYYALTNPVLRAMVSHAAPAEARGRAFGIFYFVTSITALLASVITGELWKVFGAAIPFYTSAALSLTAAMMIIAIPKRLTERTAGS
ncbi:MAG TPA: MFS transporter [Terriglobales bacterium]|nr:MFS transporter [Terriglobales bacterium]